MITSSDTGKVIFLYHQQDKERAMRVITAAQAGGVSPWSPDTHILFGENCLDQLESVIDGITHAVIFLSPGAQEDALVYAGVRGLFTKHVNRLVPIQLLYDGAVPFGFLTGFKPLSNAELYEPTDIGYVIARTLAGQKATLGCDLRLTDVPIQGSPADGVDVVTVVAQPADPLSIAQLRSIMGWAARRRTGPNIPVLIVLSEGSVAASLSEVRDFLDHLCPPNVMVALSYAEVEWELTTDRMKDEPVGATGIKFHCLAFWARGDAGAPLFEYVRSSMGQVPDLWGAIGRAPVQPCFRTAGGLVIGALSMQTGEDSYCDRGRAHAGAYCVELALQNLTPNVTVVFQDQENAATGTVDRLLRGLASSEGTSRIVVSPHIGVHIGSVQLVQQYAGSSVATKYCYDATGNPSTAAVQRVMEGQRLGSEEGLNCHIKCFRRSISPGTSVPSAYKPDIRLAVGGKRKRVFHRLLNNISEHRRGEILAIMDPTLGAEERGAGPGPQRKRLIESLWRTLAKMAVVDDVDIVNGGTATANWVNGGRLVVLAGHDGNDALDTIEDYLSRSGCEMTSDGVNPFDATFAVVIDGLSEGFYEYSATNQIAFDDDVPKLGGIWYCTFNTFRNTFAKVNTIKHLRQLVGRELRWKGSLSK